jgi:hypothetical protein
VPVSIALPPPEDRSFADVWSALGGELKPSLDVVVSVPVRTGQRFEAGPRVTTPVISVGGTAGTPPREQVGASRPVPAWPEPAPAPAGGPGARGRRRRSRS